MAAEPRKTERKRYFPRNFWQSLVAVVVGNAVYFLFMNHLPRAARHTTFKFDLGLVVDFWICLVIYGLLELLKRRHRPHRERSE